MSDGPIAYAETYAPSSEFPRRVVSARCRACGEVVIGAGWRDA